MARPFLAFVTSLVLIATCGAQKAPTLVPESGVTSSEKYTNAFFGFSLPLPQDSAFRGFSLPPNKDSTYHSLFGLQALKNGLTVFTVSAKEKNNASMEDAHDRSVQPKSQNLKKTTIGGKDFWRGESQEKSSAGKMRQVAYVTALNGYILEFQIMSFVCKIG